MKIFVTGSSGMMGWGIKKVFTDDELILTTHKDFDVTKHGDIGHPDIIFHLAAETDHYRAQLNPEHTYMVNHTGTMKMVEFARELDIPIVYIGTCGMYAGEKLSYREEDRPVALNHYGCSKYYGEQAVRSWPKHYILRSGWAMGGGPGIDKKFSTLIFNQIVKGNNEVWAISDVFGSPTYTVDFARTLKNIIKRGACGTYHVAPPDYASRYEVAKEFVRLVKDNVIVHSVSYDQYHARFPLKVRYTKNEVLDTGKIVSHGLSAMRPWKEALADYVKECYANPV